MPHSRHHSQSPGDDYFNDLSRQPAKRADDNSSNGDRRASQEDNGQLPKPKRMACVLCRKRKLKCDGTKPSCGTCTRLQHDCSYDEVRRKSGPKRGYVKALEARLAQVETLLKTQDDPQQPNGKPQAQTNAHSSNNDHGMVPEFENIGIEAANVNMMHNMQSTSAQHDFPSHSHGMLGAVGGDVNGASEEPFPWEMIGLGLDEPLPTQDVVNELNQIYFEKVHPSLPMIHRPRYYAAMNLAPHMRPPVCLRYAMWCNAAAVCDKYEALQEHFYQRARKYAQQDEMKGHGEGMITVGHCQTWALLATHEFKLMYFPRAWMSSGRASRLSQMMGLHRLDGTGLDVKQCLPPPKDWTEREERRRTFWMCFSMDRYASIGTGWPMTIEESDILTCLPAEDQSFDLSKPQKTMSLFDALEPSGPPKLSSFAGVIVMACLFGRNLTHLHRPGPDDRDDDMNGAFWRRHHTMDIILLNTAMSLPENLRLPAGRNNPNIVFMNMNIHTSTICLHQAAIFKADKNRMPPRISAESKVRCITAAAEIASMMRQVSHLDLAMMNPFISFCLYVAARVFVQYLKSRPSDGQVKASLQFLLSAMHAIKRRNPLTESFLVQLDVDLEGAGLENSNALRAQMQQSKSNEPNKNPGCPFTLGMQVPGSSRDHPVYGNNGIAAYNKPDQNIVDPTSETTRPQGYTNGFHSLPTRQRTPGSSSMNGTYQSPNSLNPEMDITPDGSNLEQHTPGSSTQSQSQPNRSAGNSHTGLSPPNGLPPGDPTANFADFFDPNDPSFAADFILDNFPSSASGGGSMHQQQQQQPGFVHPATTAATMNANWSGGGTGSGLTPGGGGSSANLDGSNVSNGILAGFGAHGTGILADMSDADLNQFFEGFPAAEWESGVENHGNWQEIMGRRL